MKRRRLLVASRSPGRSVGLCAIAQCTSSSATTGIVRWLVTTTLLLLLATSILDGTYAAANRTLSPIAIEPLGHIGVVGRFDGISIRAESADASPPELRSMTANTAAATLFRRVGASLEILGQTSRNGTINSICVLPRSDAQDAAVDVFIGGRFSSIGSLTTSNIARYDPQSRTLYPLERGLDGSVRALLCDGKRNILYVGGSFRAPVPDLSAGANADPYSTWGRFGGGLAKWQNGTWISLPFKGLSNNLQNGGRGMVNALALSADGNSVIVGGGFSGTADSSAFIAPNTQPVNMDSALVSAGATAPTTGQDDPRNIICSNGRPPSPDHQWLMQDNAPGYWRAQFPMQAAIALIRIKNSGIKDRGVKTFSVNSLPDNGLITMSYYSQEAGRIVTCSDRCPLLQGGDQYQYFHVAAESQREDRGLNINVLEWYGRGGGLASVEVFQRDMMAYADNRFNFPACATTPIRGSAMLTGDWTMLQLPDMPRTVMQHTFSSTGPGTASVTFKPNVPEDGFYEVYLLQPGCDLDQSCEQRTSISVTANVAPQIAAAATVVDQSVRGSRRILLYTGLVAASSAKFQPQVTLNVAQDARSLAAGGALIADAVQFVRLQTVREANGVLVFSNNGDTGITWNSLEQQLPQNAIVTALQTTPVGSLFIGGTFADATAGYRNIVEYSSARLQPLADGGTDGPVNALADTGDDLMVGGAFQNSAGNATRLSALGVFNYNQRSWRANSAAVLGGSVSVLDGYQSLHTHRVNVGGRFSTVAASGGPTRADVQAYSAWNTSGNRWEASAMVRGITGDNRFDAVQTSSSHVDTDGSQVTYLGGTATVVEAMQVSGAAAVNSRVDVKRSAYAISPDGAAPLSFSAGTFYNSSDGSASLVVAGQFSIGSMRNLAVQSEDGQWRGFEQPVTGEISALCALNRSLLVGTSAGVSAYDLDRHTLDASLLGDNGGPNGPVRRIVVRDGGQAIVAGEFSQAGGVECRNICLYDQAGRTWLSMGSGLDTPATDIAVLGHYVAAAGPSVSVYDIDKERWTAYGDASSLPGPASAVTLDGGSDRLFVAGRSTADNSTYLVRWDDGQYVPFGDRLAGRSTIRQLAVVPTAEPISDSDVMSYGFALLIVGTLYIDGIGSTSAALYDGVGWRNYLHSSVVTSPTGGDSIGDLRGLFFQIPPAPTGPKYLAVPLVILIAAAISLGLICLLVLLGLLIIYIRRRKRAAADAAAIDTGNQHIIQELPAVVPGFGGEPGQRVVAAGTPTYGRSVTDLPGEGAALADHRSLAPSLLGEDSMLLPADMSGALATAALSDDLFDTANYMAVYARYPFSATEPGELEFRAGDKIYVLDNSDDVWWMGMVDNGPGVPPSQGVFPASYASDTPPEPSPWNFF